jgi:uncharacterized protein
MRYQIILIPFLAFLISQIAKFFIKSNRLRTSFSNLLAYSGMPSTHAAIVVSLALTMALYEGWDSPFFAISAVLASVVIRDAMGIRRYLGQHGEVLNALVKDLGEDSLLDDQYPKLLEKIGHNPAQVAVGAIIGAAVSLLGYFML